MKLTRCPWPVVIALLCGCSADAPGGRMTAVADVQELILHLHLPLELAERLDGSVRAEYGKLWDAAEAGRATDENR